MHVETMIAIATALLTVGMTWGVLKTTVKNLTSAVERVEKTVEDGRKTTERHEALFSDLREEVRVHAALHDVRDGRMPVSKRRRKTA
jgi:hypothetical protein